MLRIFSNVHLALKWDILDLIIMIGIMHCKMNKTCYKNFLTDF